MAARNGARKIGMPAKNRGHKRFTPQRGGGVNFNQCRVIRRDALLGTAQLMHVNRKQLDIGRGQAILPRRHDAGIVDALGDEVLDRQGRQQYPHHEIGRAHV